jgi:hypothetical protein
MLSHQARDTAAHYDLPDESNQYKSTGCQNPLEKEPYDVNPLHRCQQVVVNRFVFVFNLR